MYLVSGLPTLPRQNSLRINFGAAAMALHIVTVMLSVSTTVATVAAAQDAPAPQAPAQQTQPRSGRPSQPSSAAPASPSSANAAPAPGGSEELLSPYDREALTAEYRIAPGDMLQVFVWREPDLSRELRVRPDGYVSVPLIGDLFAVAKTPKRLAAELTQALSQFVNNPQVTVTLGTSSTLRFYVLGKVNKAGEFPLVGRTTVMQALALAGGFLEYAKPEEIKILRQELAVAGGKAKTHEVVLPVNYKAIAQGQNLQQNVALKPGDVVVVP
jgi:polysaccharide export outer membrane protein